MRGNRSRDTKPELALRSAVHALGLRYRVSTRPLPEVRRTADLVFRRARVAIFLDGCFWHGCPDHYIGSASNVPYWTKKVSRNRERDQETDRLLAVSGWLSVRVWEHENPEEVAQRISRIVQERLLADSYKGTRPTAQ
jgi:DNA mismatch endonuclease (patch repair protein)